jgi:hypothetical protein
MRHLKTIEQSPVKFFVSPVVGFVQSAVRERSIPKLTGVAFVGLIGFQIASSLLGLLIQALLIVGSGMVIAVLLQKIISVVNGK